MSRELQELLRRIKVASDTGVELLLALAEVVALQDYLDLLGDEIENLSRNEDPSHVLY